MMMNMVLSFSREDVDVPVPAAAPAIGDGGRPVLGVPAGPGVT